MSLSVIWPTRGMQHADLHLLVRQLQHRGLDRLGAALHVGLDQDRDFLLLARLDAGQHLVQRAARAGRSRRPPCRAACACGTRRSRGRGFRSPPPRTARRPTARRPGRGSRPARTAPASVDRAALVVQHRAHPAPLGAGDHDVALPQRALLHQHGRHRTAAAIQPAFDHRAFGRALRIGLAGRGFPPAARSPRSACRGRSSWSPRPPRPASRRPSPRPRSRG